MTATGLRKLLAAAAALAILGGSAAAQENPLMPKFSLGGDKHKLTPDEQARQDKIDAEYQAATKKIPDQQAADPWAGVRPASNPATKKKPPQ